MTDNKHREGAGREPKHGAQAPQTPPARQGKNMMALFAYLWVLIIVPFLTETKSDPFVKFHLKQGLALVIFEVVGMFVGWIPILGWIVGFVIWIASSVFAIMGILNVLNGREKELPWIGKYAKNFRF